MLKGLAKVAAYRKAPFKTFAILHPIRALKWGLWLFLAKKLIDGMKRDGSPNRTRPERSTHPAAARSERVGR